MDKPIAKLKLLTTEGEVVDAILYCHQETTTIAGTTYYLLKLNTPADASGTTLSASTASVARVVWGKFVFQLIGKAKILSATIYATYRAYTGGGTVNAEIDILIRKSDGTVRTTIATGVSKSANLGTSWATYTGANYSFAEYTVVDQSDYLEIDYIANVTVKKATQYAYLRIDDNTLALADQTRSQEWGFTEAPAGWLTGWSYRKSHVINPASGAGTNYQVRIVAHYGSGTDSGEHVYLNNHCKTDFGDIRFTRPDGLSLLDYWMESKVDGDNAVFWVEVADDLTSNPVTIYIYYGNPNATSISNGDATFVFFDHFETLNTSKWNTNTLNGGLVSVADSKLKMTSNNTSHNGAGVISIGTLPSGDYAVEAYIMRETGYKGGEPGLVVGLTNKLYRDATYYGIYYCVTNLDYACGKGQIYEHYAFSRRLKATYYDKYVFGSYTLETWDGKWVRLTVKVKNSVKQTEARFIYGSTDVTLTTDVASAVINPLYVQIHYGEYGQVGKSGYCDWIAIRKYVEPEPSHGSWGSEETVAITETIVAKDYPMYYLSSPTKAQQLTSKVIGATITKINQDYPLTLIKKDKAQELKSKWT
jgi:hypothetical protein